MTKADVEVPSTVERSLSLVESNPPLALLLPQISPFSPPSEPLPAGGLIDFFEARAAQKNVSFAKMRNLKDASTIWKGPKNFLQPAPDTEGLTDDPKGKYYHAEAGKKRKRLKRKRPKRDRVSLDETDYDSESTDATIRPAKHRRTAVRERPKEPAREVDAASKPVRNESSTSGMIDFSVPLLLKYQLVLTLGAT